MDKLLGVATVGSTLANVTLLHRFLSGVTSVIALTIISAFTCCILIAGGFCAAYLGLVHYGLSPYIAAITVAIFVFLLAMMLIAATVLQMRRLKDVSHHHNLQSDIPGLSRVSNIVDAFMDGLLDPRPSREN